MLNIFVEQATRTKSTSSYYWRYGTTGSFGGESVVSDYDYYGKESYASVKNAMGIMANGDWIRTGQSKVLYQLIHLRLTILVTFSDNTFGLYR